MAITSKRKGLTKVKGSDGNLNAAPDRYAWGIVHVRRYRNFIMGIAAYYVADVAWGILAWLGLTNLLYFETLFYFIALVMFVFMWSRFVISYLGFVKWQKGILACYGYALLAFYYVALAANTFNDCFYHFDVQGGYHTGLMRDMAFCLLVAFNAVIAAFAFMKARGSSGAVHHRGMMVVVFCVTMSVSMAIQTILPLTSFTMFGCIIGNCFFHVFVIQEEQSEMHATCLAEALRRARTAEKSRSMFFSIVSHDIRTPLNAILGYSELLQCGIQSQNERDEALASIRASGTTLLQLVNDVLDLAKMDAGKMTLRPESVLLSRLTGEVFASFRMAAAEKGIELVSKTADVPSVLLDAHRFRQILFNLVGNAVKFTEHGSVTVAASYSNTSLEVSVSDTGCGIPHDMLPHVLEPFVQVEDSSHLADRTKGTGLGLSICRSLVGVMGGELVVESEPGEGSTFKICIPNISTCADKPTSTVKTVSSLKHLPKRVLVVDDSSVNRLVLTAFLKKAGVGHIDQAGDGKEALVKLDSDMKAGHPHDFVFSDFWMPNMNGLEFIEKLRGDARFGKLPVFAVTADTEVRHDVRASMFSGILLKPLTQEKLIDVLSV